MRIFLLDVSRGASVLAMIVYHFFWDLGYFGFIDLKSVTQGVGLLVAQLIGISFITIAGISASLVTFSKNFKYKFLKRIGKLIIISASISALTFIIDKSSFIFFGILHFLSICSLISLILLSIKKSYILFLFVLGAAALSLIDLNLDLPPHLSWIGFNNTSPVTNSIFLASG